MRQKLPNAAETSSWWSLFFRYSSLDPFWIWSRRMINNEYIFGRTDEFAFQKPSIQWIQWIMEVETTNGISIVTEFKIQNGSSSIVHPPYSSDLALCNFFLFQKLKLLRYEINFQSIKDIKPNSSKQPNVLLKSTYKKYWEDS